MVVGGGCWWWLVLVVGSKTHGQVVGETASSSAVGTF